MFTTELDDTVQVTKVGFSENGTKISMLKKYYYNQESIDKAIIALDRIKKQKKYGSVAFSTIGQEKKFTKHQHCIQSIVVSITPKGEMRYTVMYRACEVIKIFTGDMVFMKEVIFPIFGKAPVTFVFSNATLNSMYIPLFFIYYKKDWLKHLALIAKKDPKYYRSISTWCHRYFGPTINFKSAERVQIFLKSNLSKSERNEILASFR